MATTDGRRRKTYEQPHGNGCRVQPDCLNCPLQTCILEMTHLEVRRVNSEIRAEEMDRQVRGMMEQGMTRRQAVIRIAGTLGVKNTSNIYRKLKRHQERKLAEGAGKER